MGGGEETSGKRGEEGEVWGEWRRCGREMWREGEGVGDEACSV